MVKEEARTPFINQMVRKGATEVLARTKIPIEVKSNPETERKLHELMELDYGIVILTNHWGLMEFPSILEFCFRNPDLNKTDITLPFAVHQYKQWMANVGKKALSITLEPTLTPDAEDYYKKNNLPLPDGHSDLNDDFLLEAAYTLHSGGTVIMSPQGQREGTFPEKFRNPMLGTFLFGLKEKGVDMGKLAFLFIGTGLKGVTDYQPWRDVKWSQPHPPVEINVGKIITFNESPLSGRILTKADSWVRYNLEPIIPQAMIQKTIPAK